ncbi:4'-phosphopantetheinyl transferase [Staphylococcus epidermidis]|uniref:4'-phosphopantetheinyl transferase family protein n=1 Tax=Staphylococcus epidermidis TaxID=1282 RepID=UPI000E050AC4|nr:4'-phosphopantetheinyl transferase superfamily protein [Staphylococcus epidermidis]SUM53500.1 4'-phosphopantetheinyl transferase [Staphylococcus epidermidis]
MKLPNKENVVIKELEKHVSNHKIKRSKKYKFDEDKLRTLLGDILVRYIIQQKFNGESSDIVYNFNQYGKPFLKNNKEFNFNISHSGNWIVVATTINELIGIDIEKIENIDMSISNKIYSKDEYNLLKKNNVMKNDLDIFYELWTFKESFLKAKGVGLNMPMTSFEIKKHKTHKIYYVKRKERYFYLKKLDFDPCYKLSVCSTKDDFPEKIKVYDFHSVYAKLI